MVEYLPHKIPCSIDVNTFKAYINPTNLKYVIKSPAINVFDFDWYKNQPNLLRTLALNKIVQMWQDNPIYEELTRQEDKNYLLDNIDVTIPIKILCAHIKDNVFWKKCFINRWKYILSNTLDNDNDNNNSNSSSTWLNLYMERHLSEFLENLNPYDYEQENVQAVLDICAPYITNLDIDHLQPSIGEERTDHIPFDFILSNLPELRTFRISYVTKTIGTNFYLGCSTPSKHDIQYLGKGLKKCYELTEFYVHSTKIESTTMNNLSKCLDKGCSNLEILAFPHCRIGDSGLMEFLSALNKESFSNLRELHLSNNLLSQEAALWLSRSIKKRKIELLDISLNPIGSDGAAAIFSVLHELPIQLLDVSACSIDSNIERMLLRLLIECKTLVDIDFSDNNLGLVGNIHIHNIMSLSMDFNHVFSSNTSLNSPLNKILLIWPIILE